MYIIQINSAIVLTQDKVRQNGICAAASWDFSLDNMAASDATLKVPIKAPENQKMLRSMYFFNTLGKFVKTMTRQAIRAEKSSSLCCVELCL